MPDDNTQPDLTKNPAFAQMMGVVTQMGKNFQTLQGMVAAQGANMEKLAKSIVDGSGKPPGGKPPEEKPPSEKEIDEMSQSQLVAHMFKSMRGMLDGFGKDVNTKIDGLSTSLEKGKLTTEIEKVRDAHKDFDDFLPEIKEKVTNIPSLSLEEAYVLVRTANPDKAKQMDDKYKVGLDDTNKGKQTFGGLLPTSGGIKDNLGDDGKPVKLTATEAGDKAWEQVFGENPALAGPDSED